MPPCNCGKSKKIQYEATLVGGGSKKVPSIAEANAWADAQGKRLQAVKAVPA